MSHENVYFVAVLIFIKGVGPRFLTKFRGIQPKTNMFDMAKIFYALVVDSLARYGVGEESIGYVFLK